MEMKEVSQPQSQPQPQPQSRLEITQDFSSLKAFLASCECGEEEEESLKKQKITLKRLPKFREQDLVRYDMSEGATCELELASKKHRLNPQHSNENQVCVHVVDRIDIIDLIDCCVGCVELELGNNGNQQTFIIFFFFFFFFFFIKFATKSFTFTTANAANITTNSSTIFIFIPCSIAISFCINQPTSLKILKT